MSTEHDRVRMSLCCTVFCCVVRLAMRCVEAVASVFSFAMGLGWHHEVATSLDLWRGGILLQTGVQFNPFLGVSSWSKWSQHLLQFLSNTLSYVESCRAQSRGHENSTLALTAVQFLTRFELWQLAPALFQVQGHSPCRILAWTSLLLLLPSTHPISPCAVSPLCCAMPCTSSTPALDTKPPRTQTSISATPCLTG